MKITFEKVGGIKRTFNSFEEFREYIEGLEEYLRLVKDINLNKNMKITFEKVGGIKRTFNSFEEFREYIEGLEEEKEIKSVWDIDEDNVRKYWYIDGDELFTYENYDDFARDRACGNAFLTKEEALKELKKRQAIARVMRWKHANGMDYKPDWKDDNREEHYIGYNAERERLIWKVAYVFPSCTPVGYFKTREDVEKCIEECKEDLLTIYKD